LSLGTEEEKLDYQNLMRRRLAISVAKTWSSGPEEEKMSLRSENKKLAIRN
jgi:hypothetical protein